MRVKKNTTTFDKKHLHNVFKFVKPNNVKSAKVNLYVGTIKRGIRKGRMHHKDWFNVNKITINVSTNPKQYPVIIHRSKKQIEKGYLAVGILLNADEALVDVMAHELRHVHQQNRKHKIKVIGKRRQKFSETDADMYAIRMIRKWRNSQTQTIINISNLFL